MSGNLEDPIIKRTSQVYASVQQVAQSMETDGRTEEQKAAINFNNNSTGQIPNEQALQSAMRGKTDSTLKKSPRATFSKTKDGNGKQAGKSGERNVTAFNKNDKQSQEHQSVGAALKAQLSSETMENAVNQSIEIMSSKKSTKSKKAESRRGGATTSENSKSLRNQQTVNFTEEEKQKRRQESFNTVYRRNESLFIVGKTRDRLFNNSKLTLNSINHQPQKACTLYTGLKNKVESIDKERKQRILKVATKLQEKQGGDSKLNIGSGRDSATAKKLLNLNKGSFKMPNYGTSLEPKGAMPTVIEAQELQSTAEPNEVLDAVDTTDHMNTSIGSHDTGAMAALNESGTPGKAAALLRQKTDAAKPSPKEITQVSQSDERSMPAEAKGSGKKKLSETVAFEDQLESKYGVVTCLDQAMIDKLLKGEKAGGMFSRVKVDDHDEKESCVIRLGDFQPDSLQQRKTGHSQQPGVNPESKVVSRKALMKQEVARSFRLDKKLQKVVTIAKRRLAKSPEGKQAFKRVVEEMHLQCHLDSSGDESGWDINKEMRKFRANSKHQQIADQRLREKLVRMNKIKHVGALPRVDSLVESAYNSARAFEWAKLGAGGPGDPCPSQVSSEDFDLHSNSDDSNYSQGSGGELEQIIKREGRLTMSARNNPLDEMKMAMLGFEPGFGSQNSSALIAQVKRKIAELHGLGTIVPESTTKVIYERLCAEFQTAPINIFKHYDRGSDALSFENYGLNATQAQPITYILPYITGLRSLEMRDCGLDDKAAAMLIEASLGGDSQLRRLDFSGCEMGPLFASRLRAALEEQPKCLEELVLARVRATESLGRLAQTLRLAEALQYLDLSGNPFSFASVDALAAFLKGTVSLEYLNISDCQLRGKTAELITDALMLNQSLKYLSASDNRFRGAEQRQSAVPLADKDKYVIAAKLGRLVQGHPNLLHVDLSNTQLRREELIYLVLCVRDSKNVQGLHLTGNTCSPYDRVLMRALMPCKVRWPFPPSYQPKFEKVTGRDKVTLIMLNMCFLSTIPPDYMPEIGLSDVSTVEEVRDKIRSSEMRRQIEATVKLNELREYKKTEFWRYRDLIHLRLDTLQTQTRLKTLADALHDPDGVRGSRESSPSDGEAARDPSKPHVSAKFWKYYAQQDRGLDMFTMIDFYGRKRKCLELGHPLTPEDGKWYGDQRARLQSRIKHLKQQDEGGLDAGIAREIADLKKQLRAMPPLPPDTGSAQNTRPGKPTRVDSRPSSIGSDWEADFGDQVDSPRRKDQTEEKEKDLQRKLARVTQEGLQARLRQKAIEAAIRDADVIKRVKQLTQLPPGHVPEVGGFANPMRGHKDELIFSRVTGHPNYADNNTWFDSHECWVCQKHSKLSVTVAMADRIVDQEFQDIIVLTAMMTKRMQRREIDKEQQPEDALEVMLETKSQDAASHTVSESSGSGGEIEGDGHPAYENQQKAKRKARLFKGVGSNGKLSEFYNKDERFDSDHDDDDVETSALDMIRSKEQAQIGKLVTAKNDQSRAADFRKYTEPRNVVPVTTAFKRTLGITQQPESNLTLFNPLLTARPIQLKNVLKTVYQEYRGPRGPDRFKQDPTEAGNDAEGKAHYVPQYHAVNGVLYRNLLHIKTHLEGLNRQGGKKSLAIGESPSTRDRKSTAGAPTRGSTRRESVREPSQGAALDLTSEQLLYVTDKHLPRFEIEDSLLAKEIEELGERERFQPLQGAKTQQDQLRKRRHPVRRVKRDDSTPMLAPEAEAEELDPHTLWLLKHGLKADGQLPPVRIKSSGREFYPNATGGVGGGVVPRTADDSKLINGSRPTHALSQDGQQRLVQTSHGAKRPLGGQRRNIGAFGSFNKTQQFQTLGSARGGGARKIQTPSSQVDQLATPSGLASGTLASTTGADRETHIAYNPRIPPKEDEEENYQQFWAIFNQKDEPGALYFVGSVNNWQPIKLNENIVTQGVNSGERGSAVDRASQKGSDAARHDRPEINVESADDRASATLFDSARREGAKNVVPQEGGPGGFKQKLAAGIRASRLNPPAKLTSRFLGQGAGPGAGGVSGSYKPGSPEVTEVSLDLKNPTAPRLGGTNERERYAILAKNRKPPQCAGHDTELGKVSCQIEKVNSPKALTSQLYPDTLATVCKQPVGRAARPISRQRRTSPDLEAAAKQLEVHLFCRPGKHHFFFVRKGRHFMLSSRYDIEKYKETNIQMNYVVVGERGWRIEKPMVDRDDEWRELADQVHDGSELFDKQRSVFRSYKLDTPSLLAKMFENDLRLTKIPAKIKDKDQLAKVKQALLELYPQIKNVFLCLSCDSQYPAINKQDFDIWAGHCRLLERPGVDDAKINLQREGSIVKNELTKRIDTAKNEMLRFQFLEVVFRLAELCYQNDIKTDSGNPNAPKNAKKKKGGKIYMFQAITKLFKEHIEPSAAYEEANTMEIREQYLYNYRVNQYLERNEAVLRKIHSEYNYAGKSYLTPLDAINFVTQVGGIGFVHERSILRMYGFSKQSNVDFAKTPLQPKELYFVEFLEFFGRLAFWTFEFDSPDRLNWVREQERLKEVMMMESLGPQKKKKEEEIKVVKEDRRRTDLTMAEKIDALLAHFCRKLRLQRSFTLIQDEEKETVQQLIDFVRAERLRAAALQNQEAASVAGTEAYYDETQSMMTTQRESVAQAGGEFDSHNASQAALFRARQNQPVDAKDLRLDLAQLPQVSVPKDPLMAAADHAAEEKE